MRSIQRDEAPSSVLGRAAALLAVPLVRRTPRTVIARGVPMQEIDRVREQGVAYEHEESATGIVCAACPVLDSTRHAVAAVSVSGWVHRLDFDRVVPALRTTALILSRQYAAG